MLNTTSSILDVSQNIGSSKYPLDKKIDLQVLSKQVKVHIAEFKSQLGIKLKVDENDLETIGCYTPYGQNFHDVLDQKENELRQMQTDVTNLQRLFHPKIANERNALSSAKIGEQAVEDFDYSKRPVLRHHEKSAFSPRLSLSSLQENGSDNRRTSLADASLEMSSPRRSSGPPGSVVINRHRKSSSSLSSSLKSSPRFTERDKRSSRSRSSASSLERHSGNKSSTVTEPIPAPRSSLKYKNESRKLLNSQSSDHSSKSLNKAKSDHSVPVGYLQMSSNGKNVNAKEVLKLQTSPRDLYKNENGSTKTDSQLSVSEESSYSGASSDEPHEEESSEYEGSSSFPEEKMDFSRKDNIFKKSQNKLRKLEEVEKQLLILQQRCDILEKENWNIKKEQRTRCEKKIVDLKHRNSELVNIARRLEHKAKTLQEQNTKNTLTGTQELSQQKRIFQKLRGRMESEHARTVTEKDHHVEDLKRQIDGLKRSLRQANALKLSFNGDANLSASLKQSQKESMQLQKLAAAGSKKIIIRSLSTPVTARQKILEESNRKLRRQLATLEEEYSKACSGDTIEKLKTELVKSKEDYKTLKKEATDDKVRAVNLESELQVAKVESSDSDIRLNEFTASYNQLQKEYETVHEQLSVAIKERDAAINQCRMNTSKVKEMESKLRYGKEDLTKMKEEKQMTEESAEKHLKLFQELKEANSLAATQYQLALEKLQTKVQELEKQCHEQNEKNEMLNKQLIKLTQGTQPLPITDSCNSANKNDNNVPLSENPYYSPLDNRVPTIFKKEINANDFNYTAPSYQSEPLRSVENINEQVGNEDTEVEDFIEEELMHDMDNSNNRKLRVFIAKYTYNPYEGPNDCPETELPMVAGDYVYVYGPMDDDGFFEGELMNGRRGLVPSNFLEPVHDNLLETKEKMMNSESPIARCASSEASPSESVVSSCTSKSSSQHLYKEDISDVNSVGARNVIQGVLPYPRKLTIDKQLSHSLIIGWSVPSLSEDELIEEYYIFVNGEFRTSVAGTKSKAVVENICHDQPHRISVCAVSHYGVSDENLCVISHGMGVSACPSSLKLERIGTTNARVSWIPSNTEQFHMVTVEDLSDERFANQGRGPTCMTHLVPPPSYRYTFPNLRPNCHYKVTVSAKGYMEESQCFTRFTTPEAGPPDPPLSVQLEECQNTNYLLITWLPVTLNTMGTSNGVVVRGYELFVGDTKLFEVNSPTTDQCTIHAQTLADAFGKQLSASPGKNKYSFSYNSLELPKWNKRVPPTVTIKTCAVNGQVSDCSEPCPIHSELYSRLMKLIIESEKLALKQSRPPLLHSRESTDVDVSFSSDMSIPGLHGDKQKNNRSSTRSSVDNEDSCREKSSVLLQTRVVPSIEITHDTSSEEEVQAGSEKRTHSSGSRSGSKEHNGHYHSSHHKESRTRHGIDTHKDKSFISESINGRKSSHKNFDNDDAASVSSSHTSSSTAGDILKRNSSNRTKALDSHRLQRGESAEYSNPEDYVPSRRRSPHHVVVMHGKQKDSQVVLKQYPDNMKQHKHQHKHHHVKHSMGRVQSTISDDLSHGSHRSRSSSHNSPRQCYPKSRSHSIIRQSTLSSQSGSEIPSEAESPISLNMRQIGLFVALYDYNPQTMSPNAENCEEELGFTEGQLIKVYGEKDEDGFYFGVTHNGNRGFVPCNMVSEVPVESLQMLQDLHERGHLPSASPDEEEQLSEDQTQENESRPDGKKKPENSTRTKSARYFIADYDYNPDQLSPNIDTEAELAFSKGDVIIVFGNLDEDGFYKGKLNGKEGLIPSNFLEEISEEEAISLKNQLLSTSRIIHPTSSDDAPPIPKSRQNASKSNALQKKIVSQANVPSSSSSGSHKADMNSPKKKGGFMSKGRKLFKKLGGSQDGKHRR